MIRLAQNKGVKTKEERMPNLAHSSGGQVHVPSDVRLPAFDLAEQGAVKKKVNVSGFN